jgi:hypothetical protein
MVKTNIVFQILGGRVCGYGAKCLCPVGWCLLEISTQFDISLWVQIDGNCWVPYCKPDIWLAVGLWLGGHGTPPATHYNPISGPLFSTSLVPFKKCLSRKQFAVLKQALTSWLKTLDTEFFCAVKTHSSTLWIDKSCLTLLWQCIIRLLSVQHLAAQTHSPAFRQMLPPHLWPRRRLNLKQIPHFRFLISKIVQNA